MENNANLIALILVIAIIQILINIFSDNNIKIFDYQMLSWKIGIYSINTNITVGVAYSRTFFDIKKSCLNLVMVENLEMWLYSSRH